MFSSRQSEMRKMKRCIFLFGLFVLLAGCGGGGSDSGGGEEDGVQFQGSEVLSLSVGAEPLTNQGDFPLSANVNGDVVTFTDADQNQFSGIVQLNNSFVATGTQNLGEVVPGVRCGGADTRYTGTVNEQSIQGSIEATTECDSDDGRIIVSQQGTFLVSI